MNPHRILISTISGPLSRSPSSALLPTCFAEGSPTKIDYRKKPGYHLILTSLLEDLVMKKVIAMSRKQQLSDSDLHHLGSLVKTNHMGLGEN